MSVEGKVKSKGLKARGQRNEAEGEMDRKKIEFQMDKADRMILNEIQKKFPITHRPYLSLARKVNLKEREIVERVQKLKDVGIIRRIGASFSAKSVGFSSTLCAAKVPEGKIEEFVSVVNTYPGVTHNYEREGEFNLWFTLIAPSRKRIEQILTQISRKTGVKDILDLPALKTFKISVDFNFD
jgi:DNA-binding Lrp family transcriptional regulator